MSSTTKRLNVAELDFEDIKNNLKTFLRDQDEFQDYDFEGSALGTLIDILAYTTHYNAVNANLGINETFLDTAQFRGSVVGHARQLGYTPQSAASPIAVVDVLVNNPSEQSLTMPKGFRLKSKIGNTTYNFVTDRAYTTDNAEFRDVRIREGQFKTVEFLYDVRGDEKILIPDEDVDTSVMTVRVFDSPTSASSNVFTEAKEITSITSESRVYFINENPDGLFEITFGDGVLGTALDNNNLVRVEYLLTHKTESNGARIFTTTESIEGNADLIITTTQSARGGSEKESIDSVRRNAPLSFASQNRVVVPQDFESVVRTNFPNLDSITVWGGEDNDPPMYGKAFLSIKPRNADILSDSEKRFIIEEVIKPKSVLTIEPELVDPEFLFITLQVFFKYDPSLTNLTLTELENKVVENIKDFNDRELVEFGRVFRYSQVLSLIDNSDPSILNSFARVYVQRRFVPRLNVAQTYTLEFSVELFESFGTRPVIFNSSTFTINGQDGCRFTDISNGDGTRRVQIVRGDPRNPTIVVANAGSIIGSKITLLDFQPQKYEGSSVVIEAIPNSYNVFGKRNTILSIDCNCPRFEIEGSVDTFATGTEYSGLEYKVAPKNADINGTSSNTISSSSSTMTSPTSTTTSSTSSTSSSTTTTTGSTGGGSTSY